MPTGETKREALAVVARIRGSVPAALHGPELPFALAHIWAHYADIALGRPYSPTGAPLPVPASEIGAWCALSGITFEPWEFKALRMIDLAVIRGLADKNGI